MALILDLDLQALASLSSCHPASLFPRLTTHLVPQAYPTRTLSHSCELKSSQTGSLHLNNLIYNLLRTPTDYFQFTKLQKLQPPASHSLT